MATEGKNKFLEVKVAQSALVFTFGNGARIKFDPKASEVSDAMREQAMYHGFNQKLRDATAGFSKEQDFQGAIDAMEKVLDGIYNGSWNRAGGGAAGIVMEDLATAIATLRTVDIEKARVAVEKASPDQRATWAKNAKVAAIMADLKAKRAAEKAKSSESSDLDDIQFDE